MDNRFKLWLAISIGLLMVNIWVMSFFQPKEVAKEAAKQAENVAAKDEAKAADAKAGDEAAVGDKPRNEPADKPAGDAPVEAADAKVGDDAAKAAEAANGEQPAADAEKPAADPAQQRFTLGSIDPNSNYRMLVTLNNRGGALERVELNSPRYHELNDRSGYLGNLALVDEPGGGARVQVVGPGTPAELAGFQVGDVIMAAAGTALANAGSVEELLNKTEPNIDVKFDVVRGGEKKTLTAKLRRRPLEVIRPELDSKAIDVIEAKRSDPLSMLLTLQTLDNQALIAPEEGGVGKEIAGIDLWNSTWEASVVQGDTVEFKKSLSKHNLEIVKRYTLARANDAPGIDAPLYHLNFSVSLRNTGSTPRTVAYQLDGPTGVVLEGAWYASKVSRNWGASGLRDVIVRFHGGPPTEVGCSTIAQNKSTAWAATPLNYIAVDAQYFAAALIPQKKQADDPWFTDMRPLRVGAVPKETADQKLTNVSFRLTSRTAVLEPNGEAFRHEYQLFAGPKRPAILEQYQAAPQLPNTFISLDDLVYYGWFGWVAKPMLSVLHAFYVVVRNYGIAIIMLTVLVRAAMFPVSRKQAQGAQKMQELQPKIKELTEKYKNNPQERQRAQMELFRKHNYNPVAGCLPMFIQLPIFVGLYRSLMVDVELRQAPLISEAVRWCSNLAAPDMAYNWSWLMPDFVNAGQGFFGLGPYFNVLPLFTIVLFLWQQKMFMPPPTDEQSAMQQKMMQYMMVFMGFMFFKVASGLCLYFIVSSLWGIGERKLLPKTISTPAARTA